MTDAADTSFADLFDAIVAEVQGVPGGLSLSKTILSPKTAPQTILHRLFSLEMQTDNTGKFRDAAGARIRMQNVTTVRVAHRMNPKDQTATQRQAFVDESNVIIQMMTTERNPLCYTRIEYTKTVQAIDPSREWLFTDILFSVEFNFELAGEVV